MDDNHISTITDVKFARTPIKDVLTLGRFIFASFFEKANTYCVYISGPQFANELASRYR